MTTELEQLRAEVASLREQLAAQPVIPELPAEHDGVVIDRRPWEEAPVILCGRAGDINACPTCGHPGPSMLTRGYSQATGLLGFTANRCPACQEMRVYHRWRERGRLGAHMDVISYSPPRTIVRTVQEA